MTDAREPECSLLSVGKLAIVALVLSSRWVRCSFWLRIISSPILSRESAWLVTVALTDSSMCVACAESSIEAFDGRVSLHSALMYPLHAHLCCCEHRGCDLDWDGIPDDGAESRHHCSRTGRQVFLRCMFIICCLDVRHATVLMALLSNSNHNTTPPPGLYQMECRSQQWRSLTGFHNKQH
jgi:hypothetical protein